MNENGSESAFGWVRKLGSREVLQPVLTVLLIVVFLTFTIYSAVRNRNLEVYARVAQVSASTGEVTAKLWIATGQVLHKQRPVQDVSVVVIFIDDNNNQYPSTPVMTDKQGRFLTEGVAFIPLPGGKVPSFKLARLNAVQDLLQGDRTGSLTIEPGGTKPPATVRAYAAILFLISIGFFGITLILFLAFRAKSREGLEFRYRAGLVMTFLTSTLLVYGFGSLYTDITRDLDSGTWRSVMIFSIFEHSYAENTPKAWVLSLTAPPQENASGQPRGGMEKTDASSSDISPNGFKYEGFGAPLWVVVLAVFGAWLYTLFTLIRELGGASRKEGTPSDRESVPEDEEAQAESVPRIARSFLEAVPDHQIRQFVGNKLITLMTHQLFILFAPFGAIFVYQALVLAEATSQTVFVAISAIGSGTVLTPLLALAAERSRKALTPGTDQNSDGKD